jgi:antitoxin HigA-1
MSKNTKMQMASPPHIGKELKDLYLDSYGLTISEFSRKIGVNRAFISKVINGKAGISPAMALRLAKAFGTTDTFWLNMQQDYDLWNAKKITDLSKVTVFVTSNQKV